MKEKKITTKYILNTKVKPEIVNGTEKYPIYVQVIFNRSMTQFPAQDLETHIIKSPASIHAFNSYYTENRQVTNKKKIEDIIKYESKIVGIENYNLKGLAKRISSFYNKDVRIFIADYLYNSFSEPLEDKLTYRQYSEMEKFKMNNLGFNRNKDMDFFFSYFDKDILSYYHLHSHLVTVASLFEKDTRKLLDAAIHLEAYYWYNMENLRSETIPYPSSFSFYDWIISKSAVTFLSFWMNQDDFYQAFNNKLNQLQHKFIHPIFRTEIQDSFDIQEVIERGISRSKIMKSFELELKT